MSSTKPLKEALNGKPAPQYFNPDAQEYEYLLGKYGASRQILYGPDGNPITVTGSKLAIRASEIETLVGALTAAAVTDPAASAAVIQLLKGLLKQLQGAGTGAAPVQLTGSITEIVFLDNITVTAGSSVSSAITDVSDRKEYTISVIPNEATHSWKLLMEWLKSDGNTLYQSVSNWPVIFASGTGRRMSTDYLQVLASRAKPRLYNEDTADHSYTVTGFFRGAN